MTQKKEGTPFGIPSFKTISIKYYFSKLNKPVNSVRFKLELLSVSNVLKFSDTEPTASVELIASSLLVSNKLNKLEICCTVEFEVNELNNVTAVDTFDVSMFLTLLQLNKLIAITNDNVIFFMFCICFFIQP